MTTRRLREQLRLQILEIERLSANVADHPIMSFSLKKRLDSLRKELDELPLNVKEAKVTLLFSGKPVYGSEGIDADFLGKVLLPFQKMVQSDLAQRGHGVVGSKGPIRSSESAKLFLTALPRGSFGVELSKIDSAPGVSEDLVVDSLSHVSKLLESSAKSDEDFAAALDEISPRTINGLRQFLKIVSDEDAGVTIESGGLRSSLEIEAVKDAYKRVSEATTSRNEIEIIGTLKGILLESWRFDFLSNDGSKFTGPISAELGEDQVSQFIRDFFDQPCIGVFEKTTVYLKSGRLKESFTLKAIK